jgi:hypothetical protein
MSKNNDSFWIKYLEILSLFILLFGISMAVVPLVWRDLLNFLVFANTDFPQSFSSDAINYIRLTLSVAGAVMAGWMLLIIKVIRGPLKSGEKWAWNAILYSLVLWYIVDTIYSLYLSFPENALLNSVIFLAFLIGLIKVKPVR